MNDSIPQKNEYKEPWSIFHDGSIVRNENYALTPESKLRAVTCVNALAGCPDPRAFIEAARIIVELAREGFDSAGSKRRALANHDALSWLKS